MRNWAHRERNSHPILAPVVAVLLCAFCLTGCIIHQTTPPPEIPSSPQDALFQTYLAAVQARLYEQKFLMKPFYGAAKENGVLVAILLDARGNELGSGIRQSSGNADVDRTALAMVARASPFPPPPPDLMKNDTLGMGIAIPLPKTRREWREAFE